MTKHPSPFILAFIAVFCLFVVSCSETTTPTPTTRTEYGTAVNVATGSGRSYVVLNTDGTPLKIGLALTEGAFVGNDPAQAEKEYWLQKRTKHFLLQCRQT
jgi:hypothetical protein